MGKTQQQLEKEAQAAIKQILSVMEDLAATNPVEFAKFPDKFTEARRVVVRRIWTLFKDLMNHGNTR